MIRSVDERFAPFLIAYPLKLHPYRLVSLMVHSDAQQKTWWLFCSVLVLRLTAPFAVHASSVVRRADVARDTYILQCAPSIFWQLVGRETGSSGRQVCLAEPCSCPNTIRESIVS
jgi:hypothetical protein